MRWMDASAQQRAESRRRREAAAHKYQPRRIRLLLIAEAPPEALERYFYFEDVKAHDGLVEHVCEVIFESKPAHDKIPYLKELRRRGIFLIDLKPDGPIDGSRHTELAQWLPLRVETLQPEKVVIVGTPTYKAAAPGLKKARLAIMEHRIPFPDQGHPQDFVREFRAALVLAGLERLIRPLPSPRKARKEAEPAEPVDAEEEAPATDVPDEPPPRRPRAARARRGRPTRKGRRSASKS